MDNIKSLFGSKCYDTDYKTTNIFWRFGIIAIFDYADNLSSIDKTEQIKQ